MSSEDFSSEKNIAPPNYSWQDDSSSSKSLSAHRAELNIVNPNDWTAYDFCKQIFKGDFRSPVSSQLTSGIRVLHIGAGDTRWVEQMSKAYPNSNFEYVTIIADVALPEQSDNVKYYSWNIQENISYSDSVFDFVNVDSMIVYLRTDEWPILLLNIFRIVKPGCFVELFETELWGGNMGPTDEVFITTLIYSLKARGVYTRAGRELGKLLKNAGFTNIIHYHVSVPLGWGEPIGIAYGQLSQKIIKSMSPFIMKSLAWTEERLSEERAKVEQDWINFKSYNNLYKAYAQKP